MAISRTLVNSRTFLGFPDNRPPCNHCPITRSWHRSRRWLRRRAVEDGSVPDVGARALVEPRPFLTEHFGQYRRTDDRAEESIQVRRVIRLRDERRLQWMSCTVNRQTVL